MQVFVTGTDTGIGKTFVTAGLAAVMQSLGYKAGVYKPFQSGAEEKNGFLISPDLSYVKKIGFFMLIHFARICSMHRPHHMCSARTGCYNNLGTVSREFLTLKQSCETVLVEGAGGLMVPVTKDALMGRCCQKLDIPILIVARPDLGTINHTLLTINQAKVMGLDIAVW